MAAVYAALLSLARSLHQILDLQQHIDPVHREKIVYLYEKVDFIVNFLEDYSDKYHATFDREGNGIRKAAYEAQDFMESYMFLVSKTNGDSSSSEADHDKVSLDRDLNMALERIDFIWDESIKMKNNDKAEDVPSRTYSSSVGHSSAPKITTRNMTVGLDGDLNIIKERLYEDPDELQIIPIVGMGGIGKTTLARRAYEDSLRAQYFDFCAWITLSANYQRREILSGLLQNFKKPDAEEFDDQSEAHLATLVYQNLVGRRYLIVIDDIWSTKAWDDLKMIFPADDSRSRILLTTRLLDVAVHSTSSSTPLHQMNFLNEDQSWKLLQERTFGRESCPLALMEIGKKIARSCGGLPLTIVVVAGLLSMANLTKKKVWENISENISSAEPTLTLHCSKILDLSYDSLPLRLKPCFLYIAAFPEDSEIDVSKLIKLWVAEGFLKPHDHSKCLEDVGEWYLEDLVNRSLILVSQKGPDGRLKTIGIHDLLREICIKKAEEEGFLYHFSFKRNNPCKDAVENPARRIGIHYPSTFVELRATNPSVRSLLIFSNIYFAPRLSICCRKLCVLDAPALHWSKFSNVISTFVNLRYIAFTLDFTLPLTGFPASISKHPNLQTIIVHSIIKKLQIPYEVSGMPKLRHLIMNTSFHLSYPSDIGIVHGSDLQTLETVINLRFTEEAIKMLVNLKKLKAEFDMYQHEWDDFNLNNLFRLQSLVELQVTMGGSSDPSMIWNHAFPVSLKKLSLHGVSFPWGNMTIIGSLPNLQVLEMIDVRGNEVSEWKPTEGQFLRLKYFYSSLDDLVKWEVEKEHFPNLEILILMNVVLIHEIPCGIGEIDSLQLIELRHCRESLRNSAKQIQKQQHENGNDAFQVRFIVSHDDFFHLKID